MNKILFIALLIIAPFVRSVESGAEEIGHVDTVWKMVGPNHRLIVEAFDDPDIPNVTCWVSRPVSGGLSGAIGLATDPSNASIACRQRGPIMLSPELRQRLETEIDKKGSEVFKSKTSPLFKSIQVTRLFDTKRNTILYLVWSDHLVEGSPKSSLSVVPISPWPQ